MNQNNKKCIRIVPFSSSVTAHERLSHLPVISLNTLITVQENDRSHLPDWISPSLLRQIIKKKTSQLDLEDSTEDKKISRIYMFRNSEIGTEFLLQYEGEKFSKWECEKDLLTNSSFPIKLDTFQQESFDFNLIKEIGCPIIAISHRIIEKKRIYLFKVTTLNFIVYFWEPVRDINESNAARNYDYYLRSVSQKIPDIPTTIPKYQSDSLLKFQIEGVQWIIERWINKEQFIIGDDIGFGKAIQFLSFLDFISKNSEWHGPFIIIANIDQILKWKQEIENWTNFYSIIYDGDEDSCSILREFGFPSVDEQGKVNDNNLSFNILLISYELYSRDYDKLQEYKWQIVCLDNPTSLITSHLKLSSFLNQLNDRYKVILLDNLTIFPIQQMIYILNFLRPGIKWTNSLFTTIYQERTKQLLDTVVLCRTKQVINIENDLIKEYLAFVMPTPVQKIMLHLIKLHELTKMCHPKDIVEFSSLQDNTLSRYVCNHPFLVDGAEDYLSSRIKADKKSQLIGVSAKFLALDRFLTASLGKRIKIAIFAQSKQYISLIEEILRMNQMNCFTFDEQMSEIEIQSLLRYFNSPTNEDIFIILSSISLNVIDISSIPVVLILDFNMDSQLPIINTEPFFSKIKIPKKNIFRLITFGTIEHEQYIKKSKENELLSSILISSQNIKKCDPDDHEVEINPPDQSTLIDPPIPSKEFDDIINEFQKVAQIIPTSSLTSIENSFAKSKTIEQTTNDRDFLSFITSEPKQTQNKPSTTTKPEIFIKNKNNISFKDSEIPTIIMLLKKYGYGSWNDISQKTVGHNSSQIFEFCAIVVILSFRLIQGSLVPEFPTLLVQLDMTVPDFSIDLLFCSESKLWSSVFYNSHSFNRTLNQIRKSKDFISKEALPLLRVLEMRCIYQIWETNFGVDFFAFNKLPPVKNKKIDHIIFNQLRDKLEIEIDDDNQENLAMNFRLNEIVQLMKYDLIIEQKFIFRQYFSWWCEGEFNDIMRVLTNYGYGIISDIREFHAKTGILSKNSQEIKRFVLGLKNSISSGKNIFISVHQMNLAPDSVQKLENFTDWSNLKEEDILDVKFADEFSKCSSFIIQNFNDVYFDVPLNWKKRDFKKLLLLISQFGLNKFDSFFEDPSFALPSRESCGDTVSIFKDISSFFLFISRIKDEFENC